jgi:hypothetical protein
MTSRHSLRTLMLQCSSWIVGTEGVMRAEHIPMMPCIRSWAGPPCWEGFPLHFPCCFIQLPPPLLHVHPTVMLGE